MGCDGGTIPKRDELVRMKKKPEQVDKNYEINAKWFHCALSQAELQLPIVACELGNLYNKEAVLEYLLDKASVTSDVAKHIRSLKDVKELNLTENSTFKKDQAGGGLDFQASWFMCPVVGIEMNGRYKFCLLWKCGCVLSERALKEVPSEVCHKCGKSFAEEDVVVLNGQEEEVTGLRMKMEEKRMKLKMEKKAKKTKASETLTSTAASSSNGESSAESGEGTSGKRLAKRPKLDPQAQSAANGSSKVIAAEKGQSETKVKLPQLSKYKNVAEDPNASKVFKSLFSSGAKEWPKHLQSNWVTHRSYIGWKSQCADCPGTEEKKGDWNVYSKCWQRFAGCYMRYDPVATGLNTATNVVALVTKTSLAVTKLGLDFTQTSLDGKFSQFWSWSPSFKH